MAEIPGRVPPQNISAEQALLGCILLDGKAFDNVIPFTKEADDFYDPRHKRIFKAMLELYEGDSAIDSLTTIEALRTKGQLEDAGGASYVSSLSDSVPTSANVEEYAKIVKDKSILRHLIDLSTRIIETSFKEEFNPDEILAKAETDIFNVTNKKQKDSTVRLKDIVGQVYEDMKLLAGSDRTLLGLATGYKKLDDLMSGLQKSELIILAARPSIGKTSLALNIAYNAGTKEQQPANIIIFSLEMNAIDLIRRFFAVGAKVKLVKIRTGRFINKEEEHRILDVAGKLSDSHIWLDTDDNNVLDIRAKARAKMNELKKDGKTLDLVIVDYLQLVRPSDMRVPREQQISFITRSLKILAKEINAPVMALSQLNREPEKRERTRGKDKKVPPRLSDLRESGAIEQDADVVIFIDREDEEEQRYERTYSDGQREEETQRNCRLIIAKNRNGPTGEQKVVFVQDFTSFAEASERDTDEAI